MIVDFGRCTTRQSAQEHFDYVVQPEKNPVGVFGDFGLCRELALVWANRATVTFNMLFSFFPEEETPEAVLEWMGFWADYKGYTPDRYSWCGVSHGNTANYHIHVTIPAVDLATGNGLDWYRVKVKDDFVCRDTLRRYLELKYSLQSPDAHRRLISRGFGLEAREKKGRTFSPRVQRKDSMHEYFQSLVVAGVITDSAGIEAAARDLGLEVHRHGRGRMTVALQDGEKLRLRGAIYDREFTLSRHCGNETKGNPGYEQGDPADRQRRLDQLGRELARLRESNRERVQKRDAKYLRQRCHENAIEPKADYDDRSDLRRDAWTLDIDRDTIRQAGIQPPGRPDRRGADHTGRAEIPDPGSCMERPKK
jgi:hypothetical protein